MAPPSQSQFTQIMNKIMELSVSQARTEENVEFLAKDVGAITKIFQGNGVPGMSTRVNVLEDNLVELQALVKQIASEEKTCRAEALVYRKRNDEYPSLTWLLRYRPKQTIAVLSTIVAVVLVFIAPWVEPTVLPAILQWAGAPANIIALLR